MSQKDNALIKNMHSYYSNIIYIDKRKLSLNQYKYKKV